jgi:hypothetical protein
LADDWAPRLASQMATSTSATVINSPAHSIHEVFRWTNELVSLPKEPPNMPGSTKYVMRKIGPTKPPHTKTMIWALM